MTPSASPRWDSLRLALIPFAVALNVAGGELIKAVKLPIYLDTLGTVLVGALAGPWAGLATGVLSNLIWSLSGLDPSAFYFAPVGGAIGFLAGFFVDRGNFRTWWRALIAGTLTGLVAALLAAPIAAFVFGGVTGGPVDAVVALFRSAGMSIIGATAAQGVFSDPLDKAVTFGLVWLVMRALPVRTLARFGGRGARDAA